MSLSLAYELHRDDVWDSVDKNCTVAITCITPRDCGVHKPLFERVDLPSRFVAFIILGILVGEEKVPLDHRKSPLLLTGTTVCEHGDLRPTTKTSKYSKASFWDHCEGRKQVAIEPN